MIDESGDNDMPLEHYRSISIPALETPRIPEDGIVCTTHIAIHEDYVSSPKNGSFNLNHPWSAEIN